MSYEGGPSGFPFRQTARMGVCVLALIGLAVVLLNTILNLQDIAPSQTMRIIQEFAQGAFFSVWIAAVVAAVYIGTRADE